MTNFYILWLKGNEILWPYAIFAISTPFCNVYLLALTQIMKLTLLEVITLRPKKQHFLAKSTYSKKIIEFRKQNK